QERQKPPVDLLRKHKVPIAIATDCNPGSSPCLSLLTILIMACVLFRLTPFEAFKAVTRNAAQALGWSDKKGQIKVGFDADFVVWDINHPDELSYYIGANPCVRVINGGEIIYEK
ncbi:MAG: amidohydrolase family protein, partial [Candidatus Berkiella sp.]